MGVTLIIPLIGQLLTLTLKVADIIEKAQDVSPEDKATLKKTILEAKNSVTYWGDGNGSGN